MIIRAFQEAPEAAVGLPPVLSDHHAIYYSTPHGPHVLKVCLLRRLQLIKNKVRKFTTTHLPASQSL